MPTTTQEWIDELKRISVLELSERIKALEEEFGVSAAAAAAPAAVAAPGGAAEGAAEAEEQTALRRPPNRAGDKKIQVIKVVRAATGLGLKEPRRSWTRLRSPSRKASIATRPTSSSRKSKRPGGASRSSRRSRRAGLRSARVRPGGDRPKSEARVRARACFIKANPRHWSAPRAGALCGTHGRSPRAGVAAPAARSGRTRLRSARRTARAQRGIFRQGLTKPPILR